eukprot:2314873-Pleurochrysis_carterae.AAC.1
MPEVSNVSSWLPQLSADLAIELSLAVAPTCFDQAPPSTPQASSSDQTLRATSVQAGGASVPSGALLDVL